MGWDKCRHLKYIELLFTECISSQFLLRGQASTPLFKKQEEVQCYHASSLGVVRSCDLDP
jgi:hypothetical protein